MRKLKVMNELGTILALIERAEADGIPITLQNVYPGSIYVENLLKARHKVLYSKDFPKQKKPSILEKFACVDDVYLKRAPKTTLEGQANTWLKRGERQQAIADKTNPPVYDRAYVERAEFTVTDLYNDIRSFAELSALFGYVVALHIWGFDAVKNYPYEVNWGYYVQQRRKFRKCRYKFCLNMFAIEGENIRNEPAKRSDSRYCCETCRKADYDATKRFKEHGSYLPVKYYSPCTDEYTNDTIRENESATTFEKIERQQAKIRVQSPVRRKKAVIKHGEVITFKSLEEAKKAYENTDQSGRFNRRNFPIYTDRALRMPIKILG